MKISRRRLTDYVKKLHPAKLKRAARAAGLFFLVQPIKALICGVVVVVAARAARTYEQVRAILCKTTT